ncbi:unnamed protein product [Amoebophrya sp. A120]|nr:unnamed protein product [Amoebophrya sp. A120]|eukprot:GSA120T00014320001.1
MTWNSYKKHAWGFDEWCPTTMKGSNDSFGGIGMQILDSLSALLIFDMDEEFIFARDNFVQNLDFKKASTRVEVSVFELMIRAVGGLLSAYAMMLEKILRKGIKAFVPKSDYRGKNLKDLTFDDMTQVFQKHKQKVEDEGRRRAAGNYEKKPPVLGAGSASSTSSSDIKALAQISAELSKNTIFLQKAEELIQQIIAVFRTPSGFPFSRVRIGSGLPVIDSTQPTILSEIGTMQLELRYLSFATKNATYARLADTISHQLHFDVFQDFGKNWQDFIIGSAGGPEKTEEKTYPQLLPTQYTNAQIIPIKVLKNSRFSLGGQGDSYFEYLLKQYLQDDEDLFSLHMWEVMLKGLLDRKKGLVVGVKGKNENGMKSVDELLQVATGSDGRGGGGTLQAAAHVDNYLDPDEAWDRFFPPSSGGNQPGGGGRAFQSEDEELDAMDEEDDLGEDGEFNGNAGTEQVIEILDVNDQQEEDVAASATTGDAEDENQAADAAIKAAGTTAPAAGEEAGRGSSSAVQIEIAPPSATSAADHYLDKSYYIIERDLKGLQLNLMAHLTCFFPGMLALHLHLMTSSTSPGDIYMNGPAVGLPASGSTSEGQEHGATVIETASERTAAAASASPIDGSTKNSTQLPPTAEENLAPIEPSTDIPFLHHIKESTMENCFNFYRNSPTALAPEAVFVPPDNYVIENIEEIEIQDDQKRKKLIRTRTKTYLDPTAMYVPQGLSYSLLRPETVESLFYLDYYREENEKLVRKSLMSTSSTTSAGASGAETETRSFADASGSESSSAPRPPVNRASQTTSQPPQPATVQEIDHTETQHRIVRTKNKPGMKNLPVAPATSTRAAGEEDATGGVPSTTSSSSSTSASQSAHSDNNQAEDDVHEEDDYLHQTTSPFKYKQMGHFIWQGLKDHGFIPYAGFTTVPDVTQFPNVPRSCPMHTFVMSETLVYLYLLFKNRNNDEVVRDNRAAGKVVDLKKWVFNTEAHPLPRIFTKYDSKPKGRKKGKGAATKEQESSVQAQLNATKRMQRPKSLNAGAYSAGAASAKQTSASSATSSRFVDGEVDGQTAPPEVNAVERREL